MKELESSPCVDFRQSDLGFQPMKLSQNIENSRREGSIYAWMGDCIHVQVRIFSVEISNP